MKKTTVLIIALGIFLTVLNQIGCSTDTVTMPGKQETEQIIKQKGKEFAQAINSTNAEALNNIFSDNFTVTNSKGQTLNRAEAIEIVKSTTCSPNPSVSFEENKSIISNDSNLAVISGTATTANIGTPEKRFNTQEQFTAVWQKIGDDWRLASIQTSPGSITNLETRDLQTTGEADLQSRSATSCDSGNCGVLVKNLCRANCPGASCGCESCGLLCEQPYCNCGCPPGQIKACSTDSNAACDAADVTVNSTCTCRCESRTGFKPIVKEPRIEPKIERRP